MKKLTAPLYISQGDFPNAKLPYRISLIALLMGTVSLAYAEDYFDPSLLNLPQGTDPSQVDLSSFTKREHTPAGRYMVTLLINQQDSGNREIQFTPDPQGNVVPEITPKLLADLGVNIDAFPALKALPPDAHIMDLASYITDAKITFDMPKLRLNLSIPQVAMKPDHLGYVDPSLLDQGIPALLLNYQLSGGKQWLKSENGTPNTENNNLFASVRGGANLSAWRLRSNMTYNYSSSQHQGNTYRTDKTNFSNTYLMRDIQPWKSEILVGENSTQNDVLDSIPFKGVRLASNEQMLPTSLRGFAPQINGIAQSNARITIRQNGNIVYQTYVAPGAFSIKDLYPTGTAGDLEVTITEEDGTVRTFTQSFSTLPVMLRSGSVKYEVTAGRYDGGITTDSKQSEFLQGSLIYGLPHSVTLYGGGIAAKDYWAGVAGAGVSLGAFGALSSDVTHATATINDEKQVGQSYRVRYSKNLLTTGTSVDLTALRYSTKNYYNFTEFNNSGYSLKEDVSPWLNERQRNSFQTSINQSLGSWGSIYIQGSRNDYWGKNETITNLSLGYNGNLKEISYNLNYGINRTKGDGDWPENRQIMFSVNVPLSVFSPAKTWQNISSNYQITHDNQGGNSQQLGVNGYAMDNKFTYSLTQSHDNQDQGNNGTVNIGYMGDYGDVGGGYSYGRNTRSINMNTNGGMVAHSGGLTLSRYLGNSIALIEAPDADGTTLSNGNAAINQFGYAVSPYLIDYNKNTVSLNLNTLPENVMPDKTSVNLYPTKGAVVKAKFDTRKGYQALINLQTDRPLPLGAIASIKNPKNPKDINSSIVGENGQTYFSGMPETGRIDVTWGADAYQSCVADFDFANIPENQYSSVRQFTLTCYSITDK
ncbi:fimbria/pilus outer membrane usher protein [Pragia fontium]|uniref:fimbria/pilus outer membrane usher protein n=1 Tax=Pragia fontium TaxID=82985 RepID=UPI000F6D71FE|nr:fimbria/pilus outer membrane usher protein [Pragia fontium]VEJ55497.1 Outer membrane usher protein fimD precursor [Pragia fontium]